MMTATTVQWDCSCCCYCTIGISTCTPSNAYEELNRSLFLDDQIHLNKQGYIKMDSCIIETIRKDLKY